MFEGCYSYSTDLLQQNVVNKIMIKSSVGICQEMCYHENGYRFAVKVGIDELTDYLFLNNKSSFHFIFLCLKRFCFNTFDKKTTFPAVLQEIIVLKDRV